MSSSKHDLSSLPQWLQDTIAMREIEGEPLTDEEIDMFLMFEREGWSSERRRAYIMEKAKKRISEDDE